MSDLSEYLKRIPQHNHYKLEWELDSDNQKDRDLIKISKSIVDWENKLSSPFGLTRTDVADINEERNPAKRRL